jgi:mono/diheme cytochrome c family protein
MLMMKKISIIAALLPALIAATVGCNEVKREPGKVYMPDMAYSRAYETYSPNPVFVDGQTNRQPVAGTVKRGEIFVYHLAQDKTGDTTNYYASRATKNPLPALDDSQMKEAERLYLVNCGICHGSKLDGNGPLWKDGDGPYPSKPATLVGDSKYEQMPEGQMFYSITYGKNLMGGYASQLDAKQRWMVIHYIKVKQGKQQPVASTESKADSTSVKP